MPSQSFGILNLGAGTMNWTVQPNTLSGGNWLRVSPSSGISIANSLDIPQVEVLVDGAGLNAGHYSGSLVVSAPGADNSPQTVGVDLTVLPLGSPLPILVRPAGLIFATLTGGTPPSARSVRVATATPGSVTATLTPVSFGGNWLDVSPRNGSFSPNSPLPLSLTASPSGLAPGVYKGAVQLLFSGSAPAQNVDVLFQLIPAAIATEGRMLPNAAICAPRSLALTGRILRPAFSVPTGFPTTVEVEVRDDCGNTIPNDGNATPATVVSAFNNGDGQVTLVHVGNGDVGRGVYQGTWTPQHNTAQVTVTTTALAGNLQGQLQFSGGVQQPSPTAQKVFSGGIVDAASYSHGLALGGIVSVFGQNLASSPTFSSSLPLPKTLAGVSMNIGGLAVPLFYSSGGQINAQVPMELSPNPRYQAVITVNQGVSGTPVVAGTEVITLVDSSPAVFTADSSGKGQGAVLLNNILADAKSPAHAGDVVVIYCTGLGATLPAVASGTPAPGSPLSHVVRPVTATIGGVPATVQFAGLSPGFVGLYQVNVQIPTGVPTGAAVELLLTQNGLTSNKVTLAIQ